MRIFLLLALGLISSTMGFGQSYCSGDYLTTVGKDISSTPNITYGSYIKNGDTIDLQLDFYAADTNIGARPLVILAHGGSFIAGQRTDMAEICADVASRGFAAATITYRLHTLADGLDTLSFIRTVAGAVQDMRAAIRYFYKDAATDNLYNIDTNAIIIGGGSAGAILALHTAFLDSSDVAESVLNDVYDGLGGWQNSSGNQEYGDSVVAVLNLSGGVLREDYIDNNIPVVSFHGTDDEVVFYESGKANGILNLYGSARIHPILDSLEVKNLLVTVEGGGHTDIYFDAAYSEIRDSFFNATYQFFEELLCGVSTSNDVLPLVNTNVYPNPAQSEVFLESSLPMERVMVYDLQGRIIHQQELLSPQAKVPVQGVPSGMYIIHIKTQAGVENRKLIIQN